MRDFEDAFRNASNRNINADGDNDYTQKLPEKIFEDKPMFRSDLPPISTGGDFYNREKLDIPFIDTFTPQANQNIGERRSFIQSETRSIGRVTFCNGSSVVISTEAKSDGVQDEDMWSVGQMISISCGDGRIVALVREMRTEKPVWDDKASNNVSVSADLMGEVTDNERGVPCFKRGVSRYPAAGSLAHKIRVSDLECIFDIGNRKGIKIGTLTQNNDLPAMVGLDDILNRHVAIVGTTGVGKTCAVSLLVLRALAEEPNLRVLMLDPHNEFAGAFGNKSNNLDQNNLDLPFWLLNYDEIEDVVFRGKSIAEESDILRELIFNAKLERTLADKAAGRISEYASVNVDTPIPYRISDLIKQIDEILGHLEPRFNRLFLKSLKTRIEMTDSNPRYAFMFGRNGREDNFANIVAGIFRLPSLGKPMTSINLSGLPSEVTNCVVSVLARLSFDVAQASNGAVRVLLVCEEAHRYVPVDSSLGFMPTRRSIAKIAKEGRKYGCAIAVVTQRPGELDPTILSQCSTVFAMRLANDYDQEIIRSALADSSASIVSFLSSLDNREAIAFGEGVPVPMRLHFDDNDLNKLRLESGITSSFIYVKNADDVVSSDLVLAMRGMQSHKHIPTVSEVIRSEPLPSISKSSLLRKPLANIDNVPNDIVSSNDSSSDKIGFGRGWRA